MRGRAGRGRGSRGMVTVEIAVGLMVVALLLYLCAFMLSLFLLQDKVEAVAVQVARHEARGDAEQAGRARARAPRDARIRTEKRGGWVEVEVTSQRRLVGLKGFEVTGRGSAPLEPGAL